ncbi:MAG: TIGR01777 family oxidoreductase [Deltaproteobacteria bacterium]|nr:TIGR01777 family oxidoreductase [Deltaproteobacteria bacterium]
MRIVMSGSTGFIGSYLQKIFAEKGWTTRSLKRQDVTGDGSALREKISQADVVINLAGAPIAARWTEAYKKELYTSRVSVTDMIVRSMSGLERKPAVFISACGVGIYPSGGTWTENDTVRAQDFLGHLAQSWEQAALKAEAFGVRTVVFRFGVVLGRGGGALAKMLPIFKLGLGGIIGSGEQAFSWVHIGDLGHAHCRAIQDDSLRGVYNLTAPYPITNTDLTRALARSLRRPALLPVPAFVLKLLYGEGATVLLDGQSVVPKRLLDAGFHFEFERIHDALADLSR